MTTTSPPTGRETLARVTHCSKCGEDKPLDGFHRSKQAYDGRQTRCKVCRTAETRAWEVANREKKAANDRRYYEKNREKVAARNDKRRKRDPEKFRARWAVNNAVRDGSLIKPDTCEGCDQLTESRSLHAHHTDYFKPFDVEWLCRACHASAHSAWQDNGPGGAR